VIYNGQWNVKFANIGNCIAVCILIQQMNKTVLKVECCVIRCVLEYEQAKKFTELCLCVCASLTLTVQVAKRFS
jgi:hypothetical protein